LSGVLPSGLGTTWLGSRNQHDVIKEDAVTSRLNPYISFPGTARDAMTYYQSTFGGELVMNTFGEFGEQDAAAADKIMHAMLETPSGFTLMAADTPPGMDHSPGGSITVSISGESGDELRGYWDKLADGGQVTMPLEKQIWGDEFGMVIDKFGTPWMVNITQPK
jgi:PhnB protein